MKNTIITNIMVGYKNKDLRTKAMKNLRDILTDSKLMFTYDRASRAFNIQTPNNDIVDKVKTIISAFNLSYEVVEVEIYNAVEMNLQLLARKTVVEQATEAGFKVENSIQANIVNNIAGLKKEKITISGNQKTGEIPCINLPNIEVQKEFIKVVRNNQELLEMEEVKTLYNYMLTNAMCVNCGSCQKACYNNQAYRQYPTKAIADLRTLLNLITAPEKTIGDIAQRTRNMRVVRLNGSGEIHNQGILNSYIKLAKLNPLTTYYTYTKNYDLLAGKRLPKNLIVNVSQFGNNVDMSHYSKNTNTFKTISQEEFDSTKEDKTVKKCTNDCMNCNYCYTKKGYTILVPIHGADANKAEL